jgi:RNA polymerase sigma-70 factor (ECF subfamily)
VVTPRGETEMACGGGRPVGSSLEIFLELRPRLHRIASRLLNGAADADDVLQEVWLRWQAVDPSRVHTPGAFLATVTARVAIGVASSARVRREVSVGSWLPEPADSAADLVLSVDRTADLQTAVRVLLEQLAPAERGAYILREGFGYPHRRIADVLGLSEENTRQVLHRARRRLQGRASSPVDPTQHRQTLLAVAAAARGELVVLERLLSTHVDQRSRRQHEPPPSWPSGRPHEARSSISGGSPPETNASRGCCTDASDTMSRPKTPAVNHSVSTLILRSQVGMANT